MVTAIPEEVAARAGRWNKRTVAIGKPVFKSTLCECHCATCSECLLLGCVFVANCAETIGCERCQAGEFCREGGAFDCRLYINPVGAALFDILQLDACGCVFEDCATDGSGILLNIGKCGIGSHKVGIGYLNVPHCGAGLAQRSVGAAGIGSLDSDGVFAILVKATVEEVLGEDEFCKRAAIGIGRSGIGESDPLGCEFGFCAFIHEVEVVTVV